MKDKNFETILEITTFLAEAKNEHLNNIWGNLQESYEDNADRIKSFNRINDKQ